MIKLPPSDYKICEILVKTDGGGEWRLNKMPFFASIYDKPREKVLLLTSRQSTKSTYLRNKLLVRSLHRPGNSSLYVAPTGNQVGDFSRKKMDNVFAYNPALKKVFVPSWCAWNVTLKEFSVGGVPSRITLRSTGGAQGADRIRGGTYNDLALDEFQDMVEEHLPVIEECAATFDGEDGRPLATYIYTGTPLSNQNIIQRQYNMSKQWQWHMQCPHCSVPDASRKGVMPKSVDIYQRPYMKGGWQTPIGMANLDNDKPYLFCLDCGRDMNLPRGTAKKFDGSRDPSTYRIPPYGIWIDHNPQGRFDGYRVVRMMMPWSRWKTSTRDGILDRLQEWPERQFANEVMGLSFDSGQVPITQEMIQAVSTKDGDDDVYDMPRSWAEAEEIAAKHTQYHTFAGLDWAAQARDDATPAYTILGVFALVHGKLKLIYGHRFHGLGSNDPEMVMQHIQKVMQLFNVKRLGGDYGIGYKEMMRLMNDFGQSRVACFEYKGTSQGSRSTYDEGALKWIVPKTRTIDQFCVDLRNKQFILPRFSTHEDLTKDWLNVVLDFNPTTRSIRYEKTGADDFLHVANYANLAKRLEFQEDDFAQGTTSPTIHQQHFDDTDESYFDDVGMEY